MLVVQLLLSIMISKVFNMDKADKVYCKTCKYFTGCGDWNLCCTNPPSTDNWCGFLCYEDTPACKNYEERGDAK